MKIPLSPPDLGDLEKAWLNDGDDPRRILRVWGAGFGPEVRGNYYHWDKLRHLKPPEGFTSDEWWYAIAKSRAAIQRPLNFTDKRRGSFKYTPVESLHRRLHQIDQRAGGAIEAPEPVTDEDTRDRHLVSSLIEEAITSSQLEGASTTMLDAKTLLRSGRKPVDRSEQMIVNNYRAMLFIRDIRDEDLTPSIILELHKIVTENALDNPDAVGRWRLPKENIAVYDERDGTSLHVPPEAHELDERIEKLCEFANEGDTEPFLHPVIRAMLLHFLIGYDHPFVDGNGRTARALFYWHMAKHKYWLVEFVSISSILKNAPAQYSRSFLLSETDDNDLTYFLLYQCDVILKAIVALHEYLSKKIEEQRQTEVLLKGPSGIRRQFNHRQLAVLAHAQRHPGAHYTIRSHQTSHNVTYQTARTDLLDLAQSELLDKIKKQRTFVFIAPGDLNKRIRSV
jgi:Fic family protein